MMNLPWILVLLQTLTPAAPRPQPNPVAFKFDAAAFDAVLDRATHDDKLWVIVYGKLEVFPYGKMSRDGKTLYLGFGPQNLSPAQLVIQNAAVAEPQA